MELKELNIENSLKVTLTFKYSYCFVHLIEIIWHLDFSSTYKQLAGIHSKSNVGSLTLQESLKDGVVSDYILWGKNY